jgi:hypothetical protein
MAKLRAKIEEGPSVSDYAKGTEFIKPILNPEAWKRRKSLVARAKEGKIQSTGCPHPFSMIEYAVDDERQDEPANWLVCTLCHENLIIVDAWGRAASDG